MSNGTYDKDGKLITWQEHVDKAYKKGSLDCARHIIESILDAMDRADRHETIRQLKELYIDD